MKEGLPKAFLLYVGSTYYPGEAVEDLVDWADTVEELEALLPKYLEEATIPWWAIVEHRTMEVALEGFVTVQGEAVRKDLRGSERTA